MTAGSKLDRRSAAIRGALTSRIEKRRRVRSDCIVIACGLVAVSFLLLGSLISSGGFNRVAGPQPPTREDAIIGVFLVVYAAAAGLLLARGRKAHLELKELEYQRDVEDATP